MNATVFAPAPLCFGTFQIDAVYAMRREARFPSRPSCVYNTSAISRFIVYMHFFRRLIALLLMVTLPAYAWAALALPEVCPMQSTPMMEMASTGDACCDPADGDHGQPDKPHPCKPGQECKSSNLHQPVFPRLAQPFVAAATVVSAVESPVFSRDPTGVWRPPRSI